MDGYRCQLAFGCQSIGPTRRSTKLGPPSQRSQAQNAQAVGSFWIEARLQDAHDHQFIEQEDIEEVLMKAGLMIVGGNQPQQKHEGKSMGKRYKQNRFNIKVKPVGVSTTKFVSEGGLPPR